MDFLSPAAKRPLAEGLFILIILLILACIHRFKSLACWYRTGIVSRQEDYRWNASGYYVQTNNRDNFLSTDFGSGGMRSAVTGELHPSTIVTTYLKERNRGQKITYNGWIELKNQREEGKKCREQHDY